MVNRKMRIVWIVFVVGIIMINFTNFVMALGVTPGRTTIIFEPGLEKEIEFTVINNEHKSIRVVIFSMMGDLNGSVTLFEDHVDFSPSEERKILKYKIKLPEELSPGLHIAEIVVVQTPEMKEGETFIGATIAVVSQLYVYVPCPGKCIEADLEVFDAESNGTATFIVPVTSRGKLGIGEVSAIIDIIDYKGEKVGKVETDYKPLNSGARTELSGKWYVNVPPGDYTAKVAVFYDGNTYNFEKKFTIGMKLLTIEGIFVNDFVLGEIVKLRILVENRWSQDLKDVYANLLVYNSRKQVMADVKSSSETVPALSRKELVAYWDTVGVTEGEYSGELYVIYGDKSTDKSLLLRITANSLDISGVGYAVRGARGKGVSMVTILVVIVILLLIVNVAWFVFFNRIMRKKKR